MKNLILIILLVTGIFGTIFFFPVNIDDSYTCLSHRLISQQKNHFLPDKRPDFGAASVKRRESENSHLLIKKYFLPYALLWWISIGIVFLSYQYFKGIGSIEKKIKKNITGEKLR